MRKWLAGLAIAASGACSAHNSHTVVLDPLEALPPLVDEALLNLQEEFGEPLPLDFVAVGIAVDPVAVRWVAPAKPPPEAPVALEPILLDAVQQRVHATDPAQALYVLNVGLALDLNEPDELVLLVACELSENGERKKTLARASSGFVSVERLYCHGCRDSFASVGTHIHRSGSSGDFAAGAGFIYLPYCSSGSSGYTKH